MFMLLIPWLTINKLEQPYEHQLEQPYDPFSVSNTEPRITSMNVALVSFLALNR